MLLFCFFSVGFFSEYANVVNGMGFLCQKMRNLISFFSGNVSLHEASLRQIFLSGGPNSFSVEYDVKKFLRIHFSSGGLTKVFNFFIRQKNFFK